MECEHGFSYKHKRKNMSVCVLKWILHMFSLFTGVVHFVITTEFDSVFGSTCISDYARGIGVECPRSVPFPR